MIEALTSLLLAVGGMFVILCLWVWIQAQVRRRSNGKNPDKDVLEFMVNGCANCTGKGSCHTDDEHEVTQPKGVRSAL